MERKEARMSGGTEDGKFLVQFEPQLRRTRKFSFI